MNRRRLRQREEAEKTRWSEIRQVMRKDRFKASALLAGFGFFLLAVSQLIPHDYGFTELGALFTFSVYDLVLAMIGLGIACAMMETHRYFALVVAVFVAILLPMLLFFDPIFVVIRDSALGKVLYLIAPTAVIATGISLWLPGRFRRYGVMVAAAIVAFSFSLFIGLDDFGVGIPSFAMASVLSALWIMLTPAFLLRCFRGPWLVIPARILGSWLVVIAVIVTVSLYVPLPIKVHPDLSADTAVPGADEPPAMQDQGAYGSVDADGPLPSFLQDEPKPDPNAPSVFDSLKTPGIGK